MAKNFVKDVDCLSLHPNPTKPGFVAPSEAVDAHCHVFGPSNQFPYHEARKYTQCDAGKYYLSALRDHPDFVSVKSIVGC